jgi:outer membrane immunogenic protein
MTNRGRILSLGVIHMRKLSIACITLGALVAGPAIAADQDLPSAVFKGPPPIARVYNWTGCYLGVQGGGGFMHDSNVDSSSDPIFHGGGAIAGGQAGCNYQLQSIVLGIEGEGWWSGLSNKSTDNSTTTLSNGIDTLTETSNSFTQTQNRWDAVLAFRGGYAVDRVLFYGKAGVVWGGFRFSEASSQSAALNGVSEGSINSSEDGSKTLTGMLLGFGVEWAFVDNWLFRAEADYLNFPRTDVPFTSSSVCTSGSGGCGGGLTASTVGTFSQFASKGLLKIGVSYKFGGY